MNDSAILIPDGTLLWKVQVSRISKPALYNRTSLLKSQIRGGPGKTRSKRSEPISKIVERSGLF